MKYKRSSESIVQKNNQQHETTMNKTQNNQQRKENNNMENKNNTTTAMDKTAMAVRRTLNAISLIAICYYIIELIPAAYDNSLLLISLSILLVGIFIGTSIRKNK